MKMAKVHQMGRKQQKSLQTTFINSMKMAEISSKGRKHSGKRRNCFLHAISPLPKCFQGLYNGKTWACFGKGYICLHMLLI